MLLVLPNSSLPENIDQWEGTRNEAANSAPSDNGAIGKLRDDDPWY